MTELHEKWMGEPGPTDVLSFPMDELRPGTSPGGGGDGPPDAGLLGDVVLCPTVAAAQAKKAGHSTAGRARAALHARHPASARLRPRRARGARGDVRPAGRAAGLLASGTRRRCGAGHREFRGSMTAGQAWLIVSPRVLIVVAGLFASAETALARISRVTGGGAAARRQAQVPRPLRGRGRRPAPLSEPAAAAAGELRADRDRDRRRRLHRLARRDWQAYAECRGRDDRRELRRGRRDARGRSAASIPTASRWPAPP